MATIERNQPCPCGSGTKYKKCCFLRATPPPPPVLHSSAGPGFVLEHDGLDELSNSVVDLVQARRFDEALTACQRLLKDYPEEVDGLERSALVHAARGDHATAAAFYRKAYAFVTDPTRRQQYEDPDFYRQQAEQQEHLVPSVPSC